MDTIEWLGSSGTIYTYWIYPITSRFIEKAGNFCFAKLTGSGRWIPLYFGEADNLSARLDGRHKTELATAKGATHIHAHLNEDVQARRAEQQDLSARWTTSSGG